jgi:hypothetical protein
MATVINTPSAGQSESGAAFGTIIGIVLAVIVAALLLFYGIPYLRTVSTPQAQPGINIDTQIPLPNQNSQPLQNEQSTQP